MHYNDTHYSNNSARTPQQPRHTPTNINSHITPDRYLVDADMDNPQTLARKHMDALQTFFPGLQVLKGDLASAIETHGMYVP